MNPRDITLGMSFLVAWVVRLLDDPEGDSRAFGFRDRAAAWAAEKARYVGSSMYVITSVLAIVGFLALAICAPTPVDAMLFAVLVAVLGFLGAIIAAIAMAFSEIPVARAKRPTYRLHASHLSSRLFVSIFRPPEQRV